MRQDKRSLSFLVVLLASAGCSSKDAPRTDVDFVDSAATVTVTSTANGNEQTQVLACEISAADLVDAQISRDTPFTSCEFVTSNTVTLGALGVPIPKESTLFLRCLGPDGAYINCSGRITRRPLGAFFGGYGTFDGDSAAACEAYFNVASWICANKGE